MPTSAALRQINQARILSALRKGSSWSRVGLAEELGLNRSTTTIIVNALLDQGLVRELAATPVEPGVTGRPRVGVALNGGGAYFGGLELGNQSMSAVIVDLTGREIGRARAATRPAKGPGYAEERLAGLLAKLLDKTPGIALTGIGLTAPGMVSTAGRLDWAPWLDWHDTVLGETIRASFGVPVFVENDANAAALAEEQLRPLTEGDNLLYLLLDAGIGAGLLLNRELYRGGAGRVGEVGHISFPSSHGPSTGGRAVENVLGQTAMLQSFAAALDRPVDWSEAMTALDERHPGAVRVRDEAQTVLGWLTSTIAWTLDPDVVVYGGAGSDILRHDAAALQESLRTNGPTGLDGAWRLSSLPPTATASGAAALPMRAFFAIPTLTSGVDDRSLVS